MPEILLGYFLTQISYYPDFKSVLIFLLDSLGVHISGFQLLNPDFSNIRIIWISGQLKRVMLIFDIKFEQLSLSLSLIEKCL